jgi:TrpR-related protein YerC/YecD
MKLHRNVSARQEALAERNLCAAIATLGTAEECRAFFRDLCTPAELQAMADRWAVVEWLQRGAPYREIHRATGVSVTTIGRVARYLAAGNGGYRLAAQRLGEAHAGNGAPRERRRGDGARHGA